MTPRKYGPLVTDFTNIGARPESSDDSGLSRSRALRRATLGAILVLLVWMSSLPLTGVLFDDSSRCSVCHQMALRASNMTHSAHEAITCRECHAGTGPFGLAQTGIAVQRMTISSLTSRVSPTGSIDDDPCRECHRDALAGVITANGVRMRHSDVSASPCSRCHGGVAHRMEGVTYQTPQQDDCTACHRQMVDASSCNLCHVGDDGIRSLAPTAWRGTHGPEWRRTHGSGDLQGCIQCHRPDYCARCHGVALPHPQNWGLLHGTAANSAGATSCHGCHSASWCSSSCHGGVPMPHETSFLPQHGLIAQARTVASCHRCHTADSCDECHHQSAHPHVLEAPRKDTATSTTQTIVPGRESGGSQ